MLPLLDYVAVKELSRKNKEGGSSLNIFFPIGPDPLQSLNFDTLPFPIERLAILKDQPAYFIILNNLLTWVAIYP